MKLNFFKRRKSSKIEEMIEEGDPDIEKEERDMIRGVFGLGETTVRSIMVPRTDVFSLSVDTPFEEIVKLVVKSRHSRIPVYEDTIDNVVGFLYAKDLLHYMAKKTQHLDLKKVLRPVLFVPEGKKIDELLKEFRLKKVHIAVVVDEYGGMAGIVCLEDILEEIVGEIQDEYDNEEEEIKRISPNIYICDARVLIPDLNEAIPVELPVENSDTLGGFVFNLFGKIPNANDKISYDGVEFEVEKMDGNRIKKVKLLIKSNEEGQEKERKEED